MEVIAGDRARVTLTDIDWAKGLLEKLAWKNLTKNEQKLLKEFILNPERSLNKGFYDRMDISEGRVHVKVGKPYPICQGYRFDSYPANRYAQEQFVCGYPSVVMEYEGLKCDRKYEVMVSYLQLSRENRYQSLWAGNECVHGPLRLPTFKAQIFSWPIPPETYSDGKLVLKFRHEKGWPRNALVSEVWVYPIL